ncbi:MAG: hypothetical protein QXW00_00820 [Candidatus Woesearchaeota archaeon]
MRRYFPVLMIIILISALLAWKLLPGMSKKVTHINSEEDSAGSVTLRYDEFNCSVPKWKEWYYNSGKPFARDAEMLYSYYSQVVGVNVSNYRCVVYPEGEKPSCNDGCCPSFCYVLIDVPSRAVKTMVKDGWKNY